MIAQNGEMAVMQADVGRRIPAFEGFPIAPRVERNSTAPCMAIAMSRIDPVAECTTKPGVVDLAHASVACSTIANGRIVDIDLGDAWRVKGVLSIFTHQNLPDIVDDQACGNAIVPPGSHVRLLHDTQIMFRGQPVALVVARTPEIARLAASLVRVEYDHHAPAADAHAPCDTTTCDDDPMELGESTAIFESPSGISIQDPIKGTRGLRQYFQDRSGSGLRPQFQATLAARAALALQCSVRLVLTLQQMRDLAGAPRHASR